MDAFLCSVFLTMSQVTVAATITTLPVTVICSGSSPITVTIMRAPNSVGLTTQGQHDVVLLEQFISKGQ